MKRKILTFVFMAVCIALSAINIGAAGSEIFSDNFDSYASGEYTGTDLDLFQLPANITVKSEGANRYLNLYGGPTTATSPRIRTKNKIAGDYTLSFNFKMNAEANGWQTILIRMSETGEGNRLVIQLTLPTATSTQTSRIRVMANDVEAMAVDNTFTADEWYTVKMARVGDKLFLKLWKASDAEPGDMALTFTHAGLGSEGTFNIGYQASVPVGHNLMIDNLAASTDTSFTQGQPTTTETTTATTTAATTTATTTTAATSPTTNDFTSLIVITLGTAFAAYVILRRKKRIN